MQKISQLVDCESQDSSQCHRVRAGVDAIILPGRYSKPTIEVRPLMGAKAICIPYCLEICTDFQNRFLFF